MISQAPLLWGIRETVMASNIKAPPEQRTLVAPRKRESDTRVLPWLEFSDAAVKKLIRSAKKDGYVTLAQINGVLPSNETSSLQLKNILSIFGEMGVNVVETNKVEEEVPTEEVAEGEELVEVRQRSVSAKPKAKGPAERTDDPVRMYLREMGSVELLSRDGEIAIAKRIEAGREIIIAGLCESPLTFQAIIIWRDELNEGKVLLRDIIDLEASYVGPDGKKPPKAVIAADGQPVPAAPIAGVPPLARTAAPPAAPP